MDSLTIAEEALNAITTRYIKATDEEIIKGGDLAHELVSIAEKALERMLPGLIEEVKKEKQV